MSCPDCFRGFVHDGTPRGTEITLGDSTKAYYASPPAGADAKLPIIFYLPDVFGSQFVNSRLLADVYAKGGFHVFVVDLFNGSPLPPETLDFMDSEPSFLGSVLLPFKFMYMAPSLVSFLSRNKEAVVLPRVMDALKGVKEKAAALGGVKIAAMGFCFGGFYAATLGKAGEVSAVGMAHPSFLTDALVAGIKVPTFFALPPTDRFMPKDAEKALAEHGKQGVRTPLSLYLTCVIFQRRCSTLIFAFFFHHTHLLLFAGQRGESGCL